MSPNVERREPDSASLRKVSVNSLSEKMNSITCDEVTNACSRGTLRGRWGEHILKEWSRYLGYPVLHGSPTKVDEGSNNFNNRSIRESERSIVAGKSGKPDGAKRPCLRYAESEEGRTD